MHKLTFTLAYATLRSIIAKLTNRNPNKIQAGDKLTNYGFNGTGIMRLTRAVNEEFFQYKTSFRDQELSKCETVNDVTLLIWNKIPDNFKENAEFAKILANADTHTLFEKELFLTASIRQTKRRANDK